MLLCQTLLHASHGIPFYVSLFEADFDYRLLFDYINKLKKSKFAIPSCSRYLSRVIYKLRLNSWNTKYSQNVTCVCRNILSVKHILLECPFTTQLFQKNGYDLNAYNNVRDILYNTDVITNIVRSIVHSPVGNLV